MSSRTRGWLAALALVLGSHAAGAHAQNGSDISSAPWFPRFARMPLDTPLVVTSGFGDPRGGHFHAGLDFSTATVVGKPVYSPGTGWITRVRASGSGYGRSIYLQLDDGRLLLYGHLDAFDEPHASYVDSAQRAGARYEVDLMPPVDRFRVATGQRIAWSGESGAGPPHLHLETRVGDAAYHPLRAGVEVDDRARPRITRVVLEPVDPESRIEGSVAPHVVRSGDTIAVRGRFRARVTAMDDIGARRDLAPWSTTVSFGGREIEARFDSVSWATDMAEVDWLYPQGVAMAMYEPRGFDTRVLRARGFDRDPGVFEAGTESAGAASRLLVRAQDVAGNVGEWSAWIRPASTTTSAGAPASQPVTPVAAPAGVRTRLEPLGAGIARLRVSGARGAHSVSVAAGDAATLASRSATWDAHRDGAEWVALVPVRGDETAVRLFSMGASGSWTRTDTLRIAPIDTAASRGATPDGEFAWSVPSQSTFEPGFVAVERGPVAATAELRPLSDAHALLPDTHPLRTAWSLTLREKPAANVNPFRVGLYRARGSRWEWVRSVSDAAAGTRTGESRRLGRFALFEDVVAPRVRRHGARSGAALPYSRWALETGVTESGSGVDAIGSRFTVDGVEVPTEWDPDRAVLRWRPRTRPTPGTHRYTVRVVDRAGNATEAAGRFVVR